jgi:hypothetical protein
MARANVLRSVYKVLESYEPLSNFLGHVPGAATVQAGARIVGDSVRLEMLPLPIVILGFDSGDALATQRETPEWNLETLIYTDDVFEAAELLDLIEAACVEYRYDAALEQPFNKLQPGQHQRLEPDTPMGRVIATRMIITAHWIQ